MSAHVARGVDEDSNIMYPEARSTRRYPVRGRFVGASKTGINGDLHDLSPSGLCLSTDRAVATGQMIHLEFELPNGEVNLVAEVRRSTELEPGRFELGLKIVRIPEPSLRVIRAATTEKNQTSRPLRFAPT